MISVMALISIIILFMVGMWGSFYLGSRKEAERIFESEKDLSPVKMDYPEEVTEEEYIKSLKDWKVNEAESTDTERETG